MVAIGVDQLLSDSALYKHRCLEILKNYANLLVNAMINNSIKLFLKQQWYKLLRYLTTTVQRHLSHMWL